MSEELVAIISSQSTAKFSFLQTPGDNTTLSESTLIFWGGVSQVIELDRGPKSNPFLDQNKGQCELNFIVYCHTPSSKMRSYQSHLPICSHKMGNSSSTSHHVKDGETTHATQQPTSSSDGPRQRDTVDELADSFEEMKPPSAVKKVPAQSSPISNSRTAPAVLHTPGGINRLPKRMKLTFDSDSPDSRGASFCNNGTIHDSEIDNDDNLIATGLGNAANNEHRIKGEGKMHYTSFSPVF